jgi:cysteine-rich repeat protein
MRSLRPLGWLFLASFTIAACGGGDEVSSGEGTGGKPTKNTGGSGGKSGNNNGGSGGTSNGGSDNGGSGGTSNGGSDNGGAGGTVSGGSSGSGGSGQQCSSGAQCDDGNECTNDSCSGGNCLNLPKEGGQTCAGGAKVCKAGLCVDPGCGDGIQQENEECDDGNDSNFDACTSACTKARCGDGFIQAGESCDDQNLDESDGCTSLCQKPGTSDGKGFDPGGDGSQGVKLDDKGNVIIDPATAVSKVTKPVIWISNSAEGTISKIDTESLQELARYCTAPGCASDPSRTTVGLSGDAVVANRAYSGIPSAVRIATDEVNCVDRNGNGVIDTWKGAGPVPPEFQWQAGQPNSPDECVLWWTNLSSYGSLPRAAGFDAEIGDKGELSVFVYVGLYNGSKVLRINAATGKVVKEIPVPGNPYGLVVDKDGNVWVQALAALVKIDVKNGDEVTSHPAQCMYGITADPQGRIYTSGYGDQCVRRYDPTTGENVVVGIPTGNGGGVAIDQNGHLWTGQQGVRIDTNTMQVLGTSQAGGHGWAIDANGIPWSIPLGGSYTAYKHDPNSAAPFNYQVAKPGVGTYTYSDMTGFQLVNAASKGGIFRKTFQGCGGGQTLFESLDMKLLAPPSTVTTVSVRVAPSVAELPAASWVKVATLPPDTTPIPLNLTGGAIQVELTMKSQDLNASPILSSLTLNEKNCAKE